MFFPRSQVSEPQFDIYDRSFDEDEEEFEKRRKLYYPDCYSIIPSKKEVEHWIDNHAKEVEEIEPRGITIGSQLQNRSWQSGSTNHDYLRNYASLQIEGVIST